MAMRRFSMVSPPPSILLIPVATAYGIENKAWAPSNSPLRSLSRTPGHDLPFSSVTARLYLSK
jgi:hypothetical protein